ncbi:MAG: hypothetical protein M3Y08_01380 [Fibrobacterota bacterium]|nr:hypothetical protein [Fibrobacterota bacterium]
MSNPEIEKIEVDVKRMISQFMEVNMVAGIQVFVTTKIGSKCFAYCHGDGDWYSRFGYVVEWVEQQKERARQNVRDEDSEP